MVLLSRTIALQKVVSRFVQGPVLNLKPKIMGSSYSRSYSPNSGKNKDKCVKGSKLSKTDEASEYVEAVVCQEGEIADNEMKVFDLGEEGKVLLVKQKGEISAVGTKCTHYGAPLVNGALGDGRVRCPWHGACFSLKTGDIEDFPGFDSLPCYQVTVSDGGVKVRAKLSDLQSNKRVKELITASPCGCPAVSSVVIVGGGPSGATCAETLRAEGYKGKITMVAKENYLPYDRIKVSKIGAVPEIDRLQARTQEYYDNAQIEVLTGVEATHVDTENRQVFLDSGEKIPYSALYLATGSKPRVPDIPNIDLKNIFTVRTYDDATAILDTIGEAEDKHLVVLGLSFIGLEIAASCFEKAKSVTVVGSDTAPLGRIFGEEIGIALRNLYEEKGVSLIFETTITKINGTNGYVSSVELKDGTTLNCDVLVLGIGTTFYTEFLEDSGIDLQPNGSVTVNDKLETNVKNVFAGGDIAFAPVFAAGGTPMSIGHIGLSQYHGRMAAINILQKNVPLRTVPYFWTMLFGKSIRFAGCGKPRETIIDGDLDSLKFVVFFIGENENVISVASCMRDPIVSQFAEFLHQGHTLTKQELINDMYGWVKKIAPTA